MSWRQDETTQAFMSETTIAPPRRSLRSPITKKRDLTAVEGLPTEGRFTRSRGFSLEWEASAPPLPILSLLTEQLEEEEDDDEDYAPAAAESDCDEEYDEIDAIKERGELSADSEEPDVGPSADLIEELTNAEEAVEEDDDEFEPEDDEEDDDDEEDGDEGVEEVEEEEEEVEDENDNEEEAEVEA